MIIKKLDKNLVDRVCHGVATIEDYKSLGVENVIAIKSDPFVEKRRMVKKAAPLSVDKDNRLVTHEASNSSRDRMGDVVDARAWDLGNYKNNAQVLWMHNHSQPPVGRGVGSKKAKGFEGVPALFLTSKIFEEDKYPFAGLLWRFIEDGDLPACSVGFMPTGPDSILRPRDEKEAEKMGVMWPWGVKYIGQELLENSIVTIPALATALARKLDKFAEEGMSWALISDFKKAMGHKKEGNLFVPAHVTYEEEDELGDVPAEERSLAQDQHDEEVLQPDEETDDVIEEMVETVSELKTANNALVRELRALRRDVEGLKKGKSDPERKVHRTERKPAKSSAARKALAAASKALEGFTS